MVKKNDNKKNCSKNQFDIGNFTLINYNNTISNEQYSLLFGGKIKNIDVTKYGCKNHYIFSQITIDIPRIHLLYEFLNEKILSRSLTIALSAHSMNPLNWNQTSVPIFYLASVYFRNLFCIVLGVFLFFVILLYSKKIPVRFTVNTVFFIYSFIYPCHLSGLK